LRVLNEGGADCATLDAVMRDSGGFRMGPFELMDMIGHDVNFAVSRSVWNAFFNDPRFSPSLVQQELVDAGFLGKKSGRGFYDYRTGADKPLPQTEAAHPLAGTIEICGDSAAAQALAARLTAAGVAFEHSRATDERIAQVGTAVLYLSDGRSATQRAADNGNPDTVLLDLALDYAKATRVAVAAAGQAAPSALPAVSALLQAAGLKVSRLADIPGMIVLRTVAMLANEAADAVNQRVCSAAAADAAMRLGVNYPQGPLAWADQVGVRTLRDALVHLGSSYGEDRYRISPFLQRHVFTGKKIHD
jgi:3-hydroxybutyryl-CoA dehydrogenase